MNSNEFDNRRIQTAIDELRSEPVPPYGKDQTIERVLRPARRPMRSQVAICFAIAGIVIGFALWPQRKAMAWSKVVQSTLGTTRLHRVGFMKSADGTGWRKISEEWYDGPKFALVASLADAKAGGKPTIDYRFDGQRVFRLLYSGYGVLYRQVHGRGARDVDRWSTIEGLLSNPGIKMEKTPTHVTVDGVQLLRYAAKAYAGPMDGGFSSPVAFYADVDRGRIVRTEDLGRDGEITEYSAVDYPANIPDRVFLPPATGPRWFDLDASSVLVANSMANGVPFGKGNVLRAAIQSPSGDLYVLWTGSPPNGDGSQQPEVVGMPTHKIYAPDKLTTSRWKVAAKTLYRFQGHPLCGLVLEVHKPLSDRATLRLPVLVPNERAPIRRGKGEIQGYLSKRVGTATVRDFPVIQTMPLEVLETMRHPQ